MKGEKEVNYTDEMTREMVDRYVASPNRETVRAIAEDFGKTERSVIAKLSREKVYVKAPRLNKAGQPAVRKEQLVAYIGKLLGKDVESLVKASKLDLIRVAKALNEARAQADTQAVESDEADVA